MTDNVRVLPNWKKDATLYERLSEVALYAREHPEKFERFVMCYSQILPDKGAASYRIMDFGCDLPQQVGMFEIGKAIALEQSET